MKTETTIAGEPAVDPETQPIAGAQPRVNWRVFLWAAVGAVAVTLWAFVVPDNAQAVLGSVVGWTASWFGWFYVLLAAVVLAFVVFLATSRFGRIRLGPDDSKPEFSTMEWASMLFAAGIGTDLMFFAVAEPVAQYMQPPSLPPESVEAAREAMVWTIFHYGILGWGMYALMGIALAFFAYRKKLPLAVRSALAPILGRRVHGVWGDTIDFAALLGTIFGVATSLGIGVVMVNVGLGTVFGLPVNTAMQVAIVVVGVSVATLSAVSGVDRGIKFLSLLNVFLAVALSLWILVSGNTQYLLEAIVLNVGDFIAMFPSMVMQTFAYEDTGSWMADWTLFFWAWWVAWASFVGLFLARISKGRTIRQFVIGTLTIPFIYVLMWISIYGNSALDIIRGQGDHEFGETTLLSPEGGFYELLSRYPGFAVTAALATLTALLFYVTSADSAALVMANLSSRLPTPGHDGRPALRIFWAVTTGALTIAMLLVGGIGALQSATVIMGLPFALVMVLVMVALYRALNAESPSQETLDERERGWQGRLSGILAIPNQDEAARFEKETLVPAVEQITKELRNQGVQASWEITKDESQAKLVLEVPSTAGDRYTYVVERVELPVPSFGTRLPHVDDKQIRWVLEDGPRDESARDIMTLSKEEIIHDVLTGYEGHLRATS